MKPLEVVLDKPGYDDQAHGVLFKILSETKGLVLWTIPSRDEWDSKRAEGKITVELLNDLQVTERSSHALIMEAKR